MGRINGLIDEAMRDPSVEAGEPERLRGDLSGLLPTIADPLQAAATLYDRVAGAGPLQRYLDDDEIEEIWIK